MLLRDMSKGSGESCLIVPLCISTTKTCATMTCISSSSPGNLVPGFQHWHGITSTSSRAPRYVDAVTWLREMKDFPQESDRRHSCLLLIRHGDSFWTSPTTLCITESGGHSPHKSPGTTCIPRYTQQHSPVHCGQRGGPLLRREWNGME